MIPRLMLVMALLAAASSPSFSATRGTARAKRPAAHGTRHATSAKATGTATTKTTQTAGAAKPDSTRLAGGPRKLEDIHIEGEIPAPQVLFVTARDQRRFTRFQHQRYLKSSVQVGETTQLPTRVALTHHTPTSAGAP